MSIDTVDSTAVVSDANSNRCMELKKKVGLMIVSVSVCDRFCNRKIRDQGSEIKYEIFDEPQKNAEKKEKE